MGVLPAAGSRPYGHHNGSYPMGGRGSQFFPSSQSSFVIENIALAIPLGVGLSTLSLLTFLGNAMVVHAIRTERKLHTVSNMFILSLAVADLTVGLIVMPISSSYVLFGDWILGLFVCQFWLVIDYTASTASILNLLILSLDRYWSIRSPLKYLCKRTKKRALAMIGIVWMISALWIIPIIGWHLWYNDGIRKHPDNVCETEFSDSVMFKITTSIANFIIPMSLMVIIYYKIFREIKRRGHISDIGRSISRVSCAQHRSVKAPNEDNGANDGPFRQVKCDSANGSKAKFLRNKPSSPSPPPPPPSSTSSSSSNKEKNGRSSNSSSSRRSHGNGNRKQCDNSETVDNVDENEATSQCQTSLGSPQIISTHHKLIRSLLNPFIKRRHQTTLCPINGNVPSSVTRIGGSDKTPIGGDTNVKSVPMTNHQSLSNTALDNVGSSARVLISSESTPPLAPPPPPPPPISVPINHSEEQTTSMAITATTSTTDQLAPFLRDMRLEQLSRDNGHRIIKLSHCRKCATNNLVNHIVDKCGKQLNKSQSSQSAPMDTTPSTICDMKKVNNIDMKKKKKQMHTSSTSSSSSSSSSLSKSLANNNGTKFPILTSSISPSLSFSSVSSLASITECSESSKRQIEIGPNSPQSSSHFVQSASGDNVHLHENPRLIVGSFDNKATSLKRAKSMTTTTSPSTSLSSSQLNVAYYRQLTLMSLQRPLPRSTTLPNNTASITTLSSNNNNNNEKHDGSKSFQQVKQHKTTKSTKVDKKISNYLTHYENINVQVEYIDGIPIKSKVPSDSDHGDDVQCNLNKCSRTRATSQQESTQIFNLKDQIGTISIEQTQNEKKNRNDNEKSNQSNLLNINDIPSFSSMKSIGSKHTTTTTTAIASNNNNETGTNCGLPNNNDKRDSKLNLTQNDATKPTIVQKSRNRKNRKMKCGTMNDSVSHRNQSVGLSQSIDWNHNHNEELSLHRNGNGYGRIQCTMCGCPISSANSQASLNEMNGKNVSKSPSQKSINHSSVNATSINQFDSEKRNSTHSINSNFSLDGTKVKTKLAPKLPTLYAGCSSKQSSTKQSSRRSYASSFRESFQFSKRKFHYFNRNRTESIAMPANEFCDECKCVASAVSSAARHRNELRREESSRLRQEKKAARQLGVILGAFILCWMPYIIIYVVTAYCTYCVSLTGHQVTIWLGYLNSFLNPFLYALCNENFKHAFKKILGRLHRPQHFSYNFDQQTIVGTMGHASTAVNDTGGGAGGGTNQEKTKSVATNSNSQRNESNNNVDKRNVRLSKKWNLCL